MSQNEFFKIKYILFSLIITSIFISCVDNVSQNQTKPLIIILKADDLGDITANWNRFIKKLIDDSICAGIGVISKNVDEIFIPEIQRISTINQVDGFPVVEFWNHGYDHLSLKMNDEETEFLNTNYDYQYNHFQLAQHFFSDSLHITSHSFGAPNNRSDSKTDSIIKNFPEINVWQQYSKLEHYNRKVWKNPKYKIINNTDQHIILSIDYLSLKNLNVSDFEKNFINDTKKPYIVIQIHPAIWDSAAFEDFENIVQFYKKSHKARFMTPYQYYNYLHNQ